MVHEASAFTVTRAALLPREFFERATPDVARDLLGCVIVSTVNGEFTAGRIVETEAYLGADDPGSHAATRGITRRNSVMYGPPGVVYVYFTYGNHHMLNLVTEPDGTAGAVLIRAMEPLQGLEAMRERRGGRRDLELANGPGKLAAALGLTLAENGTVLGEGPVSVYDAGRASADAVATSGRIGLSAGHDLHLRYFLCDSQYVSRAHTGPVSRQRRTSSERGTS